MRKCLNEADLERMNENIIKWFKKTEAARSHLQELRKEMEQKDLPDEQIDPQLEAALVDLLRTNLKADLLQVLFLTNTMLTLQRSGEVHLPEKESGLLDQLYVSVHNFMPQPAEEQLQPSLPLIL